MVWESFWRDSLQARCKSRWKPREAASASAGGHASCSGPKHKARDILHCSLPIHSSSLPINITSTFQHRTRRVTKFPAVLQSSPIAQVRVRTRRSAFSLSLFWSRSISLRAPLALFRSLSLASQASHRALRPHSNPSDLRVCPCTARSLSPRSSVFACPLIISMKSCNSIVDMLLPMSMSCPYRALFTASPWRIS